MTISTSPLFELATTHEMPAVKFTSERVVGSRLLVAESQCDKRGNHLLSDYAAATDIGGGHAAQQSLIQGIGEAQAAGCAVAVRVFANS